MRVCPIDRLFTAVVALTFLLIASNPFARAQQLPIKTYTTADGLAQNMINRIVRDSRGYLWFCTAEGLSRFDGYRFANYTTDQELPHRSVRDLLQTRSGVYWVATGDGLCRFNAQSKEQRFVIYHPGESQWASMIWALYEDRSGTVWIGTEDGLYKLEEKDGQINFQFIQMGMPSHALVECIFEDARGSLWVGARSFGLYRRLADGSVQRYTTRNGLPSDRVNTMLEDRQGRLWLGSTGGLCLLVSEPDLKGQIVARVYRRTELGLQSDWVAALLQAHDGRIWVGVSGGLCEFTPAADVDKQKFRTHATAQGLRHLDLSSLAEDIAGNLWIGATGGAMRLARNGFITYTEVRGRRPFGVSSIFETRSGELCLTAGGQGATVLLVRPTGEDLSIIKPDFPKHITNFGWGWNQAGLQDREGEWWIPTGQGLCRFPRVSRFEQLAFTRPKDVYTTNDGLTSNDVWRVFEDSTGDIWVATTSTQSGPMRWDRATGVFHRYTQADGLPPNVWTEAFCEDDSGNVWISMGGALARYKAERFALVATAEMLSGGVIHALHFDAAGRMWIATDTNGIKRSDDPNAVQPSFISHTTANGLSSNQVWAITSDGWGRIYAFTGRGLDRLDPATGQVKHFTQYDGLIGGAPKAAFRDRYGALWFGADLGLSKLIPEPDSPQQQPILISGVRIAGDSYHLSELGETQVPEIRLGPSENQIQIDFVGLNFGIGEQLRYQYKLEGADADWSSPTDQRSITYAKLSSGSYQFLVRVMTSDGGTSASPASVSFTILPPVWQRWWFVTLTATMFGILIYSAYRYRLARVIELERVRTRIAADLHDDIGASLSRMAILSEVVKRQVAASSQESVSMLTDIADSARGLVGSMRDIVWAIDPRRDDLGNLISRVRQFASDVLEAKSIKWHFQIPDGLNNAKLGPDHRRHIFLFFKEAITNVARHSDSNEVLVKIELVQNQLRGEVRDDGRGFTVDANQDSTNGYAGQGLENMRRRISQLGGCLSVQSSPGEGTHLKMTIPLKKT